MSDAYSKWLEIPDHLRPPTYYQLLGIAPTELDRTVIGAAADRQLRRLASHNTGPDADESRRIEREIVQARDTLLDPVLRQRYDAMTPDAAAPWWKPDSESAAPTVPAPVEGWWKPDDSASSAPALPPEPTVATPPVEGWWQGESPNADSPPSPAETKIATEAPPITPSHVEAKPPLPASANDWWKKSTNEPPLSETLPPLLPLSVPEPPKPTLPVSPPKLPRPTSSPIVSEKALALSTPPDGGSPAKWIVGGVAAIALVGVVVLVLKKPWENPEGPPVEKAIVQVDPKSGTNPIEKKKLPPIVPENGGKVDPEIIDIVPRIVEPKSK